MSEPVASSELSSAIRPGSSIPPVDDPLARQLSLELRLDEVGTALRLKHEEYLDMLNRLQEREEQAVRRSEERFRLLVESVKDYAILMLDPEGRILSYNDGTERITGFGQAELLGRHYSLFHPSEERDPARSETELGAAAREGRFEADGWRVRKDGSSFWANVLLSALRDEENRLLGFALITRDLTERRRAEEELKRTARELQQSNRELEQFAYVASHDLQEPLRKIQAFGDRLRAKYPDSFDEQGRDYMNRMQDAVTRMQQLIEDVLALSRVATTREPPVPVDLTQTARETVSDLEARIERTGGRVEIGELPTIEAESGQMRRLLQNLISNALKFHRPGISPVVRIRSEADLDPAAARERARIGLCRLYVEDNGIGFDEKYADRIFGIFERLHGRGEYEGTGIGLAICRKIVDRHGGAIAALSTPGQGATFEITLPFRQHREERA